jgi:hypothetical protein
MSVLPLRAARIDTGAGTRRSRHIQSERRQRLCALPTPATVAIARLRRDLRDGLVLARADEVIE